MDAKDRQIIRALQENGRLTNQELAERVNLSPSPCLRRLRNLEREGLIRGYAALIDQKAYGLPITVFLRIQLEQHSKATISRFEERIVEIPEILECFLLTGGADYLLRAIVADLESFEQFVRQKLHGIPGIASIDTSFAYGIVKQTHVYP